MVAPYVFCGLGRLDFSAVDILKFGDSPVFISFTFSFSCFSWNTGVELTFNSVVSFSVVLGLKYNPAPCYLENVLWIH